MIFQTKIFRSNRIHNLKYLRKKQILLNLNRINRIYVRKSRGKKNLEIKTLEKSPNFLKSLEKISLEIKSCVLDSWDFFFLKLVGLYFRRLFNKRTIFHRTFLVWNFRTFYPETFFKDFFGGYQINNVNDNESFL